VVENKPIYVIAGPTASGKSELGIELALHIGKGRGEIINCDSVQIYREIEIATAKVPLEERRGVPHHLIDYIDPRTNYTAGDWARDAIAKIAEIEARGSTAILVGGTGFYLRALRQPFFEGSKTDEALRQRLKEIRTRKGAEHLHKMLQRIDAASAARLFPRDHVRVQRALEVFFQTGELLSEMQPRRQDPPECAVRLKIFALDPPREQLYEKINRRSEIHFESGLVEEVKNLRAAGVPENSNALGAHGYRRAVEYLRGERTLEEALEQTKLDVRHYSKRQLTWFRREAGVTWLKGFGGATQTRNMLFEILDLA
jgi:tRNA dimethylallyltransferase